MMKMGNKIIILGIVWVVLLSAMIGTASALSNSGGGDWKYYKEITIKENSGRSLMGYQVLLELNPANFPAKAKSDGSDLRFEDGNGKELNYWIEDWDFGAKEAKIWVKVPSISVNGETKIKMYYGNPSASSASDKEATMNFLETGQLTLSSTIDDDVVETINLEHNYNDPAVVSYIATRGGGQSIDTRIRNVGRDNFEIFEEEPDNEPHRAETNNWIVAESGSWIGIDGQLRIEAGTHSTDSFHTGGYFGGDTVSFSKSFSSTPSLLATLNTYNNGAFMSTHTHGLSSTDFLVGQEAAETGISASTETIGWIAFSRDSGTNDGISYEVGYHPEDNDYDGVSNSAESVFYSFGGNPSLVIQGSTPTGVNGYWARGAGTFSDTSANFYAEEDQVSDTDRSHADCGFSWAAFYTQGSITVHKYTSPEPTYTIGSEESSSQKTPPTPPSGKIKAVWLYNPDKYNTSTLMPDLKSAGINSIFLSTDVNDIWKYERFVKSAHENGIKVHAMILEDPRCALKENHASSIKAVDTVLDYNDKSLAKFDGINIDTEPYVDLDLEQVWQDYITLLEAIHEKTAGKTVLSADIPRWYDEGKIKDIAPNVDFFTIMAYDSGGAGWNTASKIEDTVASEMGAIRDEDSKAVIGIGVHEGFEDKRAVEKCVDNLYKYYSGDSAFSGVSIFKYESHSGLSGVPEVPTGEEKGIPGFEEVFAIVGLLAAAYLLRRRDK